MVLHTKERVVQCLVDLPSKLGEGGIEKVVIERLTKEGFACSSKHGGDHSSEFRLKWWKETHPLDKEPEEPQKPEGKYARRVPGQVWRKEQTEVRRPKR
ncbi:hypothetical protein BDW74DRAFT_152628 [Aspergillus multicolor]|uniref:uncharacterized protein n=1 Tax=Aspergillus multicolor TaxID=41759 RepID=UPI003CCDFF18